MSFPVKKQIAVAVALVLISAPAAATVMEDLMHQADNLPEDFSSHFFNAPLHTRVELDGQYLGDAMILLTRNKKVQLVNFTQAQESKLPAAERTRWAKALNIATPLGTCEKGCTDSLRNLQYSLQNTTLYITTEAAYQPQGSTQHISLPEAGSTGLILRNQMNLVGGEQQPWSGYQGLQLESSLGNWSGVASSQLSRSDIKNSTTDARVSSLYLQRELPNHAVRAGLFMPDNQGILRQPALPGRSNVQTLAGVMVASSDALVEHTAQPSLYPVYVTANRDAVAEIYRDGLLINSQPVQAGMQQLDTAVLPGGIYGVEIRLLEDGREISRTEETIYKPNSWGNADQRLRYNVYGGTEQQLGNRNNYQKEGGAAVGASANYLLHPRVIIGAAAQNAAKDTQLGTSADVQITDKMRFFGSVGTSSEWGSRYDSQFNWQLRPQTGLAVSHNQSWYQNGSDSCKTNCGVQRQQSSAATLNHRLGNGDALSLRGTHYSRENGLGADISWRTRFKAQQTPVSLTVDVFDRPYSQNGAARNRGANLNLNFSLGGEKRAVSASLGSRNNNRGGREVFASAAVTQNFTDSAVKRVTAGVSADRYGVGTNLYSDFEHRYASGSVYGQSSSASQKVSGGLNMQNTVAVGGGAVSFAHSAESFGSQTGVILDVESDDPQARLIARDNQGASTRLRPGRNFIPVTSYRSGQVQVDFEGNDGPALKIWPAEVPYHLNKGGVAHSKVRVMKTVTVIGRVVDHAGNPMSGARLVNHAGQGISESDGFFVTDMHEHTPELVIHHNDDRKCTVSLNPKTIKRENNTLMVGDLSCKIAKG